jgi:hypothetical protein
MIQLFGNCFGQEASTLYVGGACALPIAQTPSARKQTPLETKAIFVSLWKLAMTGPPDH